jgi:hypothetical protein
MGPTVPGGQGALSADRHAAAAGLLAWRSLRHLLGDTAIELLDGIGSSLGLVAEAWLCGAAPDARCTTNERACLPREHEKSKRVSSTLEVSRWKWLYNEAVWQYD